VLLVEEIEVEGDRAGGHVELDRDRDQPERDDALARSGRTRGGLVTLAIFGLRATGGALGHATTSDCRAGKARAGPVVNDLRPRQAGRRRGRAGVSSGAAQDRRAGVAQSAEAADLKSAQ